MTNSSTELNELLLRLKNGDPVAADRLFRAYSRRLVALARSRLPTRLRGRLDADDVVQSAFRSFFRGCRDDRFAIADWDSLWALLARIALRKCGHRVEYHRAARRDVRQESRIDDGSDFVGWESVAREPSPEEAAILVETLERLVVELDERDRSVLELTLAGMEPHRIAAERNCATRTIERALERIRRRLSNIHDE